MEVKGVVEQDLSSDALKTVVEKQRVVILSLRERVASEHQKALELAGLVKRQHAALRYLKDKNQAMSAEYRLQEATINILTVEASEQRLKAARLSASLVEAEGLMEEKDFIALVH